MGLQDGEIPGLAYRFFGQPEHGDDHQAGGNQSGINERRNGRAVGHSELLPCFRQTGRRFTALTDEAPRPVCPVARAVFYASTGSTGGKDLPSRWMTEIDFVGSVRYRLSISRLI